MIPITTKDNVKSKASLLSSPKNVSLSLNSIPYISSFETNLLIILFRLIHLYSAYTVLTLYKYLCSFVLPFHSFAFMDVVILFYIFSIYGRILLFFN